MFARIANFFRSAPPAPRHRHGRWTPERHVAAPVADGMATRAINGPRATWAATRTPHGASFVNVFTTSIIGDGAAAGSAHKTHAKAIEQHFQQKFWRNCDADLARSDFGNFSARVMRSVAIFGEALAVMVTDRRTLALKLRLLNPDQLDATKNEEFAGGRIVNGVEFDADGMIVAYWILPDAPDQPHNMARPPIRFDAADVLHVFDAQFPGQVRGTSPLGPVLTRLHEFDRLEDHLMAKHAVAALFGLVFTNANGGDAFGDDADVKHPALEAGASIVAAPGYAVDVVQPPNPEGDIAFMIALQRSIAAGLGIPYELLSGDLSNTNYSSAKLGLETFRRRVDALRRTVLEPKLLDPVWKRFLTLEYLAGRLDLPGYLDDPDVALEVRWLWPQWASLDPEKDANAAVTLVNAGLMSRVEAIAQRGRDPEEVLAEIARTPAVTPAAPTPTEPAK